MLSNVPAHVKQGLNRVLVLQPCNILLMFASLARTAGRHALTASQYQGKLYATQLPAELLPYKETSDVDAWSHKVVVLTQYYAPYMCCTARQ